MARRATITALIVLLCSPPVLADEVAFKWYPFPAHSEYGDPVRYAVEFSYDCGQTWEGEINLGLPDTDECNLMEALITIPGSVGQLVMYRSIAYYAGGQRIPASGGNYGVMR